MAMNTLVFKFKDDGYIPNNPHLPVILVKEVFQDHPSDIEKIFNQHNWQNSWVNGVFPYHHYHSNAHEVLGVKAGTARLIIGGESGKKITVQQGDVIILPAGTGHKKLECSNDFKIVGAYPEGMSYNIKTGEDNDRPQVLHDIVQVPLPMTDPIFGNRGPVFDHWHAKENPQISED
ncbi:MAG: cupin domain-containing protein [Paenisporosarcina sp.]